MTDYSWIAPTVLALGVVGKQFWEGHLASLDRIEAQKRRDATDAKVEAVGAATDEVKDIATDVGHKVDGAHSALVAKVDSLRSDKAALSDALIARDEPGALPVNDSPGPVTIDKEKEQVNIVGEDRRKP